MEKILVLMIWITFSFQSCIFHHHHLEHSHTHSLSNYDYSLDSLDCMTLDDIILVVEESNLNLIEIGRYNSPVKNGLPFQLDCNLEKKLTVEREKKIVKILSFYISDASLNQGVFNNYIYDRLDHLKKFRTPESFEFFMHLRRMNYIPSDPFHGSPMSSAEMGIELNRAQIKSIKGTNPSEWLISEGRKSQYSIKMELGDYPLNKNEKVRNQYFDKRARLINQKWINILQEAYDSGLIKFKDYEN